jgi:hypothetical protein
LSVGRVMLAGVLLASSALPASGQISTLTGIALFSHFSSQGLVKGTDLDYDPQNDVFLVVGSCYTVCPSGSVYGRFVDRAGTAVTSLFAIDSGPNGHFPRVRYAAALNGGLGGFLVSWGEEHGGGQNVVRVRPVRYNPVGPSGQALGAPTVVSDGGTLAWLEAGAAIGYSATSQRFLVSWMAYAPFRVVSRLVDLSGTPVTSIRQLSAGYGQDPAVAWNSQTNEFGVSYSAENGAGTSGFSGFAKVSAVDGSFTRQSFNEISGFARITDVAYSPNTNRWVMTWVQGLFGSNGVWDTQIAEIGADGQVINLGVATRAWVGYNSVAIARNPISDTMLLVSLPTSDETSALELNRHGYPISAVTAVGPGFTTRYARTAANTDRAEFGVTFSNNYESGRFFSVGTTSTGGGGATTHAAIGSPSSPAPVDNSPSPSGCVGPDPFVAIGGGQCVGGNWIPGGNSTPAPAPAPPSSPQPAPPSGTCSTPDPFTAIGGGTCLGGDVWIPGASNNSGQQNQGGQDNGGNGGGGAGSQTPSGGNNPLACTAVGSSPIAGWVCVGDGWVPPNHPLASQAPPQNNNGGNNGGGSPSGGGSLGVCASTPSWAVGGGWVMVGSADWVPASHPLAAQASCRGQ